MLILQLKVFFQLSCSSKLGAPTPCSHNTCCIPGVTLKTVSLLSYICLAFGTESHCTLVILAPGPPSVGITGMYYHVCVAFMLIYSKNVSHIREDTKHPGSLCLDRAGQMDVQ